MGTAAARKMGRDWMRWRGGSEREEGRMREGEGAIGMEGWRQESTVPICEN